MIIPYTGSREEAAGESIE